MVIICTCTAYLSESIFEFVCILVYFVRLIPYALDCVFAWECYDPNLANKAVGRKWTIGNMLDRLRSIVTRQFEHMFLV